VAVTTLSTIAMIFYPMIIMLFHFGDPAIGMFPGGTIHDVAQVVGAGFSVSQEAGTVATFTKLLRVSMLAALVILNSLGFIPANILEIIKQVSRWFLVIAIAGLGVKTSIKQMASVGGRAIGLIIVQTLFLAGLVLAVLLFVEF